MTDFICNVKKKKKRIKLLVSFGIIKSVYEASAAKWREEIFMLKLLSINL